MNIYAIFHLLSGKTMSKLIHIPELLFSNDKNS